MLQSVRLSVDADGRLYLRQRAAALVPETYNFVEEFYRFHDAN